MLGTLTKPQKRALVRIEHLDDDYHKYTARPHFRQEILEIKPQTLRALMAKGLVSLILPANRPTLTEKGIALRDSMRLTGRWYD